MIPNDAVLLEHGSGGLLTHELIATVFLRHLRNFCLERLEDGAVLEVQGMRLCLTTDSYVVSPIFFPGGDIGSLAVYGTVNDLAVCGGRPLALSCSVIIEEGFSLKTLDAVCASMAVAASRAQVQIVTGDTKVVPKGKGDGIYITTTGIGLVTYHAPLAISQIQPGDALILSNTIGDHGAAILCSRENIELASPLTSDSAPLSAMIERLLAASPRIHCMRDITRGGLGGILAEIALQRGLTLYIDERAIPVQEQVRGVCETFGFDPLFLANEGNMVLICDAGDADKIVQIMREYPCGRHATVIGTVSGQTDARVIMKTCIGGERIVELPTGELVPRIC
ncbi:MAG: hydrogenase expression/formation protein HypE [Desulfobacterota bacterium]|nr:hydrogenase expression/formation protein HypE [Thermodesulfobacteriota bacterium]